MSNKAEAAIMGRRSEESCESSGLLQDGSLVRTDDVQGLRHSGLRPSPAD